MTTKDAFGKKRKKLLRQINRSHIVERVTEYEKEKILKIETIQGLPDIKFMRLSDFFVFKRGKEVLEAPDRQGWCHKFSSEISKDWDSPNEVVTGCIYKLCDKVKHLHSWIEFSEEGEEFIIDATRNIVMNKEGFYFLKHVKELCRVSRNQIIEDENIIHELGFGIKEYLTFRHEIMRDVERNYKVFQKTI